MVSLFNTITTTMLQKEEEDMVSSSCQEPQFRSVGVQTKPQQLIENKKISDQPPMEDLAKVKVLLFKSVLFLVSLGYALLITWHHRLFQQFMLETSMDNLTTESENYESQCL